MNRLKNYTDKYGWRHFIITGLLVIPISMFPATGTIAENYTGQTFAAPEFLLLIITWVVGAFIFLLQRVSPLGIVIMTLAVIPGYNIVWLVTVT